MKVLIYVLIIIFANTIGAISGMGGGVIIKPTLDFVGLDSVSAISFYATVAVLTMSIVSTHRQVKQGIQLKWDVVAGIAIGSVFGGIIGNLALEHLLVMLPQERLVKLIQIGLMLVTLIFVILYQYFCWESWKWQSQRGYISCGILAGFLSSFLGIGGGPINVSLLMLCIGFPIKLATIYSIVMIFASQLAKIATIALTIGFSQYDVNLLLAIIPAAVIGGTVGAMLNKRLSESVIKCLFNVVVVAIVLLNAYNGWVLLH